MKASLNNYIHHHPGAGEVKLFREMARYLQTRTPRSVFIGETHGRKGWVTFDSTRIRPNQTFTREIADLLTVSFEPTSHEVRVSLLQAKYHRTKRVPFLVFHGDFLQLELLKHKPIIRTPNTYGFPHDILTLGTTYESFRSFGIFYHDSNGEMDFLFTIADLLNEHRTGRSTVGNIVFPGHSNCPHHQCATHSPRELTSTCSIDLYRDNLLSGKIGVPVKSSPKLSAYIAKLMMFVQPKLGSQTSASLVQDIIGSIGDIVDSQTYDNPIRGNPNILILESSGTET